MYVEQKKLYADLNIFLTIIAALIIVGLLFIYSASSVFALEQCGSSHYFVKKQLMGIALGFLGLLVCMLLPLATIKKLSPAFFFGSVLLTALTLIPKLSLHIHGSSRWLKFGPVGFQPSELLKIALIMYVAYFLSKEQRNLGSLTKSYLPFLTIIAITCIILLRQPDFGMAITVATTAFILYFIMHTQIKQMLYTVLGGVPLILILIVSKPYRVKRILSFLNPWDDPQGSGFQIIQSLIAIGSGSWLGTGVSNSKQKFFYLPMLHTDFIFSIIAEETGFIGVILLISLYTLLLYFGMRIAWKLRDTYSILITLGFVFMITLQAIINLAVTTGLAPTKGIGLPFVSYGNSALVASLCMIGLIINCVRENAVTP